MNHQENSSVEMVKTFMFECLTTRLKDGALDAAKELTQQTGFSWELFLETGDEELVSPLMYDILKEQQIAPPLVEEMLARKYEYNARRNLFLLHNLGQALSNLEEAGIETIVLKGASLAETVYKDFSLRPMRDLDLLVRREELATAVKLLAPLGYAQKSVIDRESYPVVLEKAAIEPVVIELHQSLFHSLYYQQHLALDWFWQTTEVVKGSAHSMRVLGREAQILHLCGHLTFHHRHESQLLWRNDLAEFVIINQDKISWPLLLDKAETFQLILPTREILIPIARDWGAPVPEEVVRQLEGLEVSEEERRAFRLSTAVKQSEGQGYWFRLKEIRGWRKRVGYVLGWFFPTPASLRSRYGISRPWLVPLAYPYHWWVGIRLGLEGLLTGRGEDEGPN